MVASQHLARLLLLLLLLLLLHLLKLLLQSAMPLAAERNAKEHLKLLLQSAMPLAAERNARGASPASSELSAALRRCEAAPIGGS